MDDGFWIVFMEVSSMSKGGKLALLIGIVVAVASIVASLTALLLYLDKKRDDEELEEYLDCSIQ